MGLFCVSPIGINMPKITAMESQKQFNEYYLEDLGIKLEEFKTSKWIGEPFVENLQKDYDKQMDISSKFDVYYSV